MSTIEFSKTDKPTVSLTEAARQLGMHRSTAVAMAKAGEFPIPVLRVGKRHAVAKAALVAYLSRMGFGE